VVQVGAFSDAAKVREVRRKLEQAGLSTFTQVVDGKDGKTTTRVRVGPFGSREEAETAAARIRKLDFSPAVLRI
jgi:DedD protein